MSLGTDTRPSEPAAEEKRGRGRLVVVALVVVALLGAGYWFLLRPGGGPAERQPGEVVTLEPVQVNLADGHFLRVGIALQLTADAHEVDGARALDATISTFSGRSMDELTAGKARARLKAQLLTRLEEIYEHHVMDLYFTEFVMQ